MQYKSRRFALVWMRYLPELPRKNNSRSLSSRHQTQTDSPDHTKQASHQQSLLHRNDGEAEDRNKRPKLEASTHDRPEFLCTLHVSLWWFLSERSSCKYDSSRAASWKKNKKSKGGKKGGNTRKWYILGGSAPGPHHSGGLGEGP